MYFFRIVCREYKNTAKVGGYIEIALVEANPRNVGEKGRYKGVGAHLFAIASQILHANVLHDRIMQLDTEASQFLVGEYAKKARDMNEK